MNTKANTIKLGNSDNYSFELNKVGYEMYCQSRFGGKITIISVVSLNKFEFKMPVNLNIEINRELNSISHTNSINLNSVTSPDNRKIIHLKDNKYEFDSILISHGMKEILKMIFN